MTLQNKVHKNLNKDPNLKKLGQKDPNSQKMKKANTNLQDKTRAAEVNKRMATAKML